MRKTIICLFPRDEGESLPHLEWKHWRMMCLEERSLRKTKRIKVQGAEAKGNTLAKWEEMPSFSFLKWKGEEHHNYMTVKFYTEGVENWDLICSHWQPPHPGLSMNCQQVSASRDTCTGKKCGQPTGTMESHKHDHRTGRFKFGAHLVLIELLPPFQSALQACSADALLGQGETRLMPKAMRLPKHLPSWGNDFLCGVRKKGSA